MKLHSLEIEGFGPFKNKQVVDFAKFAQDGLFLIEGQTGAGKSSILDALTYALYNFTARWMDSNANAEFKSVRSHFSAPDEPTRVQLIFELSVGDKQQVYRIVRSIPGLKKDGSEKPVVVDLFEVFEDGTEQGIASGVASVAGEITKLVRLDKTEFLQVVLLAQGRFQAFLEATSDQRLELLRKLFDTKRFADIQRALAEKASEIEGQIKDSKQALDSELASLSDSLEVEPPVSGDELSWIADLLRKAESLGVEIEAAALKAKEAHDDALVKVQQATNQIELHTLKQEKVEIESGRKEHDADKAKLKAAQKAARLSGLFEALNNSEDALKLAKSELDSITPDKKIPRTLETLKPLLSAQSTLKQKLAPLVEEEESLEEALEEIESFKQQLNDLEADFKEAGAKLESLKSERTTLAKEVGDLDALREAKQDSEVVLTEFMSFQALEKKAKTAEKKADDALKALTKATDEQQSLTHNYRASLAFSLAKDLKEGDACLVCGSKDHPTKAKTISKPVTDEELNAANEARSDAASHAGVAKTEYESILATIEPLSQKFKDASKKSLGDSKTKAEESFTKASAAATRIEEIAKLLDPDSDLQKTQASLAKSTTAKSTEIKGAEAATKKIQEKLAKNLGGFTSVSEHLDSVESLLERMAEVSDALVAVALKQEARDRAAELFTKKLATEGFASTSAFEKAFIEPDELEELATKIEYYADSAKRIETLLQDEKFKSLPNEKLDIVEVKNAAEAAEAIEKQKQRELGEAKAVARQISLSQGRIAKLLPKIEKYAADYEVHRGLANMANGKEPNVLRISLESYFAAAELEVILEAANSRLKTMSAAQYTLKHSDKALKGSGKSGLGIEVMDEFTGRERQPETLSGGEKFQVSLAIALGLAQVVSDRSGAIRVDTLFVDEGFGSLSADVLDTAMRVLDSLKQGGRTIGLISHVEQMKEEISAKLLVEKTPRGPSLIRQG
jgi:exonuclease SbcC